MAQESVNGRKLAPAVQGELVVEHHVPNVHVQYTRVDGRVEPGETGAHVKGTPFLVPLVAETLAQCPSSTASSRYAW